MRKSPSIPKPSQPVVATRGVGDSILEGYEDDDIIFTGNSGQAMPAAEKQLKDQFVLFQISNLLEMPSIMESSQVTSSLVGSEENPDVLVQMEMQSFNLGANEDVDPDTRGTLPFFHLHSPELPLLGLSSGVF